MAASPEIERRYVDQQCHLVRRTCHASGMSLRQIARLAGTSHATLIAYRQGTKSPTFATLMRVLDACGFAPDIALTRRVRSSNGVDRGDELIAALDLAAQFPARHSKTLRYPKFGRTKR